MNRFSSSITVACAVVLLTSAGCSRETGPPGPPPVRSVPVLTAKVEQKATPKIIETIGQIEALATVSIKPQVTGQLAEVHFEEGQEVKVGQLLFSIDRRPFEIALKQEQAALEKARAAAENARRQAERYTELKRRGAVAAEQSETITLNRDTTAAAFNAAEAAVRKAELELEYCSIRSPIAGRTGHRLADPGNVVSANTTDLLVINQIEPVYVTCTVAERFLGEIQHYLAQPGGIVAEVRPEGQFTEAVEGPVTFVDNTVKPGSGTLRLKARLANEKQALWPGQFVSVVLRLTVEEGAILAPQNAVVTGQRGEYAFVVNAQGEAELRNVKIDRRIGAQLVIREGLKPGEEVVVDGQSQLTPGAKVEVRPELEAAVRQPEPSA